MADLTLPNVTEEGVAAAREFLSNTLTHEKIKVALTVSPHIAHHLLIGFALCQILLVFQEIIGVCRNIFRMGGIDCGIVLVANLIFRSHSQISALLGSNKWKQGCQISISFEKVGLFGNAHCQHSDIVVIFQIQVRPGEKSCSARL